MVQFIWGAEQRIIEMNAYRVTTLTASGFMRGIVDRSKNLSAPHYFYVFRLDIFA